MSRLQNKCLLASVSLHTLLGAIVLFSPAFLSHRPEVMDLPVMELVPINLTDKIASGGGNPNITRAMAPMIDPKAALQQEVRAAAPKPEARAKPVPNPPTVKATPPAATKETPAEPVKEKTSRINGVNVNLTPVKRNPTTGAKPAPAANNSKASPDNADEKSTATGSATARLQNSLQKLRDGLSGATEIKIPGPGGELYGNWAQAVKSIYENAWHQPDDQKGNADSVEVEITILQNGRIALTKITRKSGDAVLDRSVQQALDSVDRVRPFPEGATDSKRVLNIIFKLNSNHSLG